MGCDEGNILQGSDATKSQCTASSEYHAVNYPAVKAWNGLDVGNTPGSLECWICDTDNYPDGSDRCWLQWNFGENKTLDGFRMATRDHTTIPFPKDVKLWGSATGVFGGEETVLGTYQNADMARDSWAAWHDIASPDAFQYYRIVMTSGWNMTTYVCVQEVEFCILASSSSSSSSESSSSSSSSKSSSSSSSESSSSSSSESSSSSSSSLALASLAPVVQANLA